MTDLERARHLLQEGAFTCVLCKDEKVYTSTAAGISPMLDLIREGHDLHGFSAADKIVGKAAAMLFALAGIAELHAQVLSRFGAELLRIHGIAFTYDTLTEYIINRKGDGICPMEQTVADIDAMDLQTAFDAVYVKREELRKDIHQ